MHYFTLKLSLVVLILVTVLNRVLSNADDDLVVIVPRYSQT